jgi:peroxiredoxin
MKRLLKALFSLSVLSVLATTSANAQSTIAIDEFGNDTLNGVFGALPYTVGLDPTGGIPAPYNVLSYGLPFAGTQGDLLIFDPFERGDPLDDVIRFVGNGQAIYYADNLEGYVDLADVPGPPNPLYPNLAEAQIPANFIVDYTPTAGQPGFDASDPSYQFYIDNPITVPEPCPAILLVIGLGAFGLARIRPWRGIQPFHVLCLLAAALPLTGGSASGQDATPQTPEICIGQRAPSFTLKDQNDREISLDAMLKNGPVAVVFIRSAEWCTACQLETIVLQHSLKKIEAAGGQVVIISYDAPEKLKRFSEKNKITYPLLSDYDSKTIDAYDMRARVGGNQAGSSQHGAFVVDQKGVVRAKPFLTPFDQKSGINMLIKELKEAKNVEGGAKL